MLRWLTRTALIFFILILTTATQTPSSVYLSAGDVSGIGPVKPIIGSPVAQWNERKELERYIDEVRKRIPTSPGLAVAVVRGETVIFQKGFGYRDVRGKLPVTPQTQFYIASTTKSFTGTAARILADEKKIDLDAPIKVYFPELKLPPPLTIEQISLRDLLTHRSGIRNDAIALRTAYTGQYDTDTLLRLLADHSRVISPEYQYSNIGYIVAALAMEKAAKEPWQQILQNKIFTPLGMNNTSAYISKAKASGDFALPYLSTSEGFAELPIKSDVTMHAAGGIVSSAEDLSKWLIFNMNRGNIGGKQIMPALSLEEVHSPQIDQSRSFYKFKRYAYGLGWNLGLYGNDKLIHCFGEFAGYRPHVSFMPEHRIGIVVLANESSESIFLPDLIAADIYDHLLGKKPLQSDPNPKIEEILAGLSKERSEKTKNDQQPSAAAMSADLAKYAGTYENVEIGRLVISIEGGKLWARLGNLSSALKHTSGDTFQADFKVLSPANMSFKMNGSTIGDLTLIGRTFTRK